MDTAGLAIQLAKAGFVAFLLLNTVPLMVWLERRGAAFIQDRPGPNRVNIAGFALAGLVQPLADVVKFIFKEDFIPPSANRAFYVLAPVLTLIPALMTFAVVPFGDVVRIDDPEIAPLVPAFLENRRAELTSYREALASGDYARIQSTAGERTAEQSLIVVPASCVTPAMRLGTRDPRALGVIANLYSLRREHDWGVGDFDTLIGLVEWASARGTDFVGVNVTAR